MRESPLNGDNLCMRRTCALAAIASTALLAACGGGGSNKQSSIQTTKPAQGGGGVVQAVPSKGILGPATTVDPQGAKTIGKTGPISPRENRPTDAQANGVAGGVACSSTSADPSPANLSALSGSILCLLNAERSAKGLPALHANGGLAKAAHSWANRMVAARFFAHESGASTPLKRIKS